MDGDGSPKMEGTPNHAGSKWCDVMCTVHFYTPTCWDVLWYGAGVYPSVCLSVCLWVCLQSL